MSKPILYKFSAGWCSPCRVVAPILREIAEENKDFDLVSVDMETENGRELASAYGVVSIPTMVLVSDGKEQKRMTGANSKSKIKDTFNI